jgi:hypothetical protein
MAINEKTKKTVRLAVIITLAALLLVGTVALVFFLVDNFVGNPPSDRTVFVYEDYKYIIKDDGKDEITEYFGTDLQIEIPSIIEGREVTSIGNNAFYRAAITSVYVGSFV